MNPAKIIDRQQEARKMLKKGIDEVADTVKATLGPSGRNIMIQRMYGTPHVTKDGVSVARSIYLNDPVENMGAQLVKDVAGKTASDAGDGTTTATVLAQRFVGLGIEWLDKGMDAQALRRGIQAAVDRLIEQVNFQKIKVEGDALKHVASISANDKELGEKIASTVEEVGRKGVISIQLGKTSGIQYETTKGVRWEKGYFDPNFSTDRSTMTAKHNDVHVLVTDKEITATQTFVPVIEKVIEAGIRTLVVIAPDVRGDALATLVVNHLNVLQGKPGFMSLAVRAPGFGQNQKDMLDDLALMTGAQVVSDRFGRGWENFEPAWLGRVEQVKASKDTTFIVNTPSEEAKTAIAERVALLEKAVSESTNDHDKSQLQDRIANFAGGAAVIKVGAPTEAEAKELLDRVEDAVFATQAAMEDGIVAGGGMALVTARDACDEQTLAEGLTPAEAAGFDIVWRGVDEPFKQIARNAGGDAEAILEEVRSVIKAENLKAGGYDARTGKIERDMVAAGIIDPAKVTKSALTNAASIAIMVLTTEATVTDYPQDLNEPQG